MASSLEPIVLNRQDHLGLRIPAQRCNLEQVVLFCDRPMSEKADERKEFAERLNRILDEAGWPKRGRQTWLGEMFGVSQKAAEKWLKAEAMPELKRIPDIARKFDVCIEWLLSGRGPMHSPPPLPPEKQVIIDMLDEMTDEDRRKYQEVGDTFAAKGRLQRQREVSDDQNPTPTSKSA